VHAIYLDLSSALELAPHFILLKIFGAFGLSDGFASWFRICVCNLQSCMRISGIISSPLHLFAEFLKDLSWSLSCLIFLLMIF
jgi:hypothetical protein